MSRTNIPGSLNSRALALLAGTAPTADVLALLERAKHDVERGWHGAAIDALQRAVKALEGAA